LKEEKDKIKKDKKEEQKEKANKHEWRNKISLNNLKKKTKNKSRFKYIDEVPKENLQEIVFYRSRKRYLLTMMDDSGKFFSYTNRQYLKETKRLKYHALPKLQRRRITKVEEELNKHNSKSCRIEKFKNT
jgi:hypothetical protein